MAKQVKKKTIRKVTPKKAERKSNAGRPSKTYDIDQVKQLAMLQCTDAEIAAVLGMAFRTFQLAKQNDPELGEIILAGREQGKASLRRAQWVNATQRHSTQMQIHLGKNYLDQTDKTKIDGSVELKQPVLNLTLEKEGQEPITIKGERVDDNEE